MRLILRPLGALMTGALACLCLNAPANADGLNLVQCLGTETATFNPGIHLPPPLGPEPGTTTITTTTSYALCPLPLLAGMTATESWSGTGEADCVNGVLGGSGTLTWTGGTGPATSSYSLTAVVSARPDGVLILVADGTINSGRYAGSHLNKVITNSDPDALTDCATESGMTQNSGAVTLTISSL
jgi:hypothetical protein